MQKKHRIFIAINFPVEIKKIVARYQEKFKDVPAKWVKADNLHITLSFLGYISEEELGEVCMVAKTVAKEHSSFSLSLQKIAYGPDGKMPKMVWLTGEKSKELSRLRGDLENALAESINYKAEVRSFSPHITLARINQMEFRHLDLEERPEVDEHIDLGFLVESIDVMESVLTKSGPKYTIIESFSLSIDDIL